jgi:hypothetical protein
VIDPKMQRVKPYAPRMVLTRMRTQSRTSQGLLVCHRNTGALHLLIGEFVSRGIFRVQPLGLFKCWRAQGQEGALRMGFILDTVTERTERWNGRPLTESRSGLGRLCVRTPRGPMVRKRLRGNASSSPTATYVLRPPQSSLYFFYRAPPQSFSLSRTATHLSIF